MAEATSGELIPLEETALEIAWMTHARWAVLNTQELQERSAQGLLYVAEEVGPGGDIREHRLYQDLLLGAASSILPGQTYVWGQRPPQHLNPMAALDLQPVRNRYKIPEETETPELTVGVMLATEATVNLELATRLKGAAALSWNPGFRHAAHFFRGDIWKSEDRAVHDHGDALVERVRQLRRGVRPKLLGLLTVYEAMNATQRAYNPTVTLPNRGEDTLHGHVWAELSRDRARMSEASEELGPITED